MTVEELVRKAAAINYEIIIAHGLDGGVGFEWQGLFIHDPFADPQYGAFPVDPAQQYGDAYRQSIFVTDPAKALEMAQRQLREKAGEDLCRYCVDNHLDATAVIETACGVKVLATGNRLETLTDEGVATVWSHLEEIGNATIDWKRLVEEPWRSSNNTRSNGPIS